MKAYCTYCSADKNYSDQPLSAISLYKSKRITEVSENAEKADIKFVILSGKYGIVDADEKIDYYDHLLIASEVEEHSELMATQLKEKNISHVVFFMQSVAIDKNIKAYADCILKASEKIGITIEFIEV